MSVFSFLRIEFSILGIAALNFLLPIAACLAYGETEIIPAFLIPMIVSVALAVLFLLAGRKKKINLSIRGAFVVVAFAWISCSLLGAVPLFMSGAIPSFTDAVWESVSGFTTTGATILDKPATLPNSISLWRTQTHWLGGMGIVALTVALFPLLGVGGFQLIKAETTGPEKGKITPKITNTAKLLWLIYVGFTAIEIVALRLAGMNWFDALVHSFSTVGTGGFSSKNASIGEYNSAAIDTVCTVFMFLASVNFSLYFYLITGKVAEVFKNTELKTYLSICFVAVLALTIINSGYYGGFFSSLRYSSFQTASIISTTGFGTADYTMWSNAAQTILMLLFLCGGCSGSTAGGVKIIRWVIAAKQANNECKKMLHPHGVFSIRLDSHPGRKDIVFSVAAFLFLYFALVCVTGIFGSFAGLDLQSAFTGALSMVGNVGPAFGALNPSANYRFLPTALKWWYMFAMLAGRLELYTMLIFFVPDFWKK